MSCELRLNKRMKDQILETDHCVKYLDPVS
jgi:hypothetical protein